MHFPLSFFYLALAINAPSSSVHPPLIAALFGRSPLLCASFFNFLVSESTDQKSLYFRRQGRIFNTLLVLNSHQNFKLRHYCSWTLIPLYLFLRHDRWTMLRLNLVKATVYFLFPAKLCSCN